jgi:phosphocarrier protein HPr
MVECWNCVLSVAPFGAALNPSWHLTFVMTNRHGMHAQPCALLVKTLRPFACEVKVERDDGEAASGKSILGLMALAAGFGSKLTFMISGSEAARVMAAGQQLFKTQFEEAYVPENKATAALRRDGATER